jgi:hypothetical protein
MTHNVTKLPKVKDNKSQVKHILLHMCQICLTIFLTHGVPNTTQVKPTEDDCEAYFTQHVLNVTLCRCQIYSVVGECLYTGKRRCLSLLSHEAQVKQLPVYKNSYDLLEALNAIYGAA